MADISIMPDELTENSAPATSFRRRRRSAAISSALRSRAFLPTRLIVTDALFDDEVDIMLVPPVE